MLPSIKENGQICLFVENDFYGTHQAGRGILGGTKSALNKRIQRCQVANYHMM